jgi:hypothetical protein
MFGFLTGKRLDGLTALFLTTTVLTSVSGFGFPFDHLLPSHKVAIISLVILAVAIPARYVFHLAGAWRSIHVIGAVTALLSERLRPGGAVLHEGACTESAGADADGASISGHTIICSVSFCRPYHSLDEEVPRRAGSSRLIRHLVRAVALEIKLTN